ncbi:mannitol dehydrogenase family protein [Herbiconiux sp. CPCC 205716]|uniref:Mannitol-1-phosphate 5-dehydrogenase n=1 Tax=Herbiconiux gentiana TaxID=2970912 RepID=A0ABT2GHQ2_9MICO|nr:mannitol dehydrogenase family protein [Herbiconiux gentiana]MCS5715754.1 mannitol dehydrogenase family protein [Herbiconiux gentiana]
MSATETQSVPIPLPGYDRSGLTAGIMHIGVGNFHRAHQAAVIDELLEKGLARDFAICGVGVLPGDRHMRDILRDQDGLYLLELRHPDGRREQRIIGSIVDYLYLPDDPEAVVEKMAGVSTRIVSLTITEGGYKTDFTTNTFDAADAEVRRDLEHPEHPGTVFGLIVEALARRRAAGRVPFTVLSCDNLPMNGEVTRNALVSFAALRDQELARWIDEEVAFPNSMVDRITPATTDRDREYVRDRLGVEDAWPVAAEPFFQWVVEDSFTAGRPPFEQTDVQIVDDVAPYELMKLRLLNGSHQALAYFGALAGHEFVEEAMADEDLVRFLERYMSEVLPTVPAVPGIDLREYRRVLLERFSNPAIRDTLARLCADSSNRIPKFVVPSILENRAAGRPVEFGAAVLASWARYAIGVDESGGPIHVVDVNGAERRRAAERERSDAGAFLRDTRMFGALASDRDFVDAFHRLFISICDDGARATYQRLAGTSPSGEGD